MRIILISSRIGSGFESAFVGAVSSKRERVHSGFTLVELLVVISIIALLISLLMPVLGSVRGTAKAAVCASNMRQLGIANHAYSTDNKSVFAPFQITDVRYSWDVLLASYLGRPVSTPGDSGVSGDDFSNLGDGALNNFSTASGGGKALACPEDQMRFPQLYDAAIGNNYTNGAPGWLSYALNSGLGTLNPFGTSSREVYVGVGGNADYLFDQPSETMHHLDAAYIRYVTDHAFFTSNPSINGQLFVINEARSHFEGPYSAIPSQPHQDAHEQLMGDRARKYRHDDTMNVLSVDGHVEAMDDIPGANEDAVFWGRWYSEAD